MNPIRLARAIGGLLSVVFLLAVLWGHVFIDGVEVTPWLVGVVLSLIGGLLAVDVFRQELPTLSISLDRENSNNND
jgi:cytochrome c biogenesis protein CcdA